MKTRCIRTCFLLLSLVFIATAPLARAQSASKPVYWPTTGWRSTTPEQQGVDSNKLADAMDYIRQKDISVHSLLIVRNGYVVLDAHFFPFDGQSVHDVASVTKSVTSTLIGGAISEGKIKSAQQPVLGLFPDAIVNRDDRKRRLTIEHLLTMSSGLECQPKENELTLRQMKGLDRGGQELCQSVCG